MQTLRSLHEEFYGFLIRHQLMEGTLVLLIGIIASMFVRRISTKILNFFLDRYHLTYEKGLISLITRPIWISVVLISIDQAIPFFVIIKSQTRDLSRNIVESILIIMWAVALSKILRIVSRKNFTFHSGKHEAIQFLSNLGIALVVGNACFALLTVWNVDITPLLASAGIAGVALALAAKDTLANFFGGISLFLDHPFKKGDFVVLGSGERGVVTEVGLRSTRIITRDDVLISIPNSMIANSKIINESAPESHQRVRIKIGVAYGSDLDKVEDALLTIARSEKMVLDKPEPRVRFRAFGDSALEYELLCWVSNARERGLMNHRLNKAIYNLFNSEGIIFPFPQREVHIKKSLTD